MKYISKDFWLNVITIILAGILLFSVILAIKGSSCQQKFFEIRLFEIIQLTVTIIIATGFSYFINRKLGNNGKINELIDESLKCLKNQINEIFHLALEYMQSPNKELENKILSLLKIAGGQINLAERLKDEKSLSALNIDSDFKLKFFSFKESITDTPFGDNNVKNFSNERETLLHKEYFEMLHAIDEIRFSIFKGKKH